MTLKKIFLFFILIPCYIFPDTLNVFSTGWNRWNQFAQENKKFDNQWHKKTIEQIVPHQEQESNLNKVARSTLAALLPSHPEQKEPIPLKTFADVQGKIPQEIIDIKNYLLNPTQVIIPEHGLMLWGPPGTGKTLLAEALAGDCNCVFIKTNGSAFAEKYVGVGASRVREIFAEAHSWANQGFSVVLFVDEIDLMGGKRNEEMNKEHHQTLNQFFTMVTDIGNKPIMVIGATNLKELLDSALTRPGRFKTVEIGLPDKESRQDFLSKKLGAASQGNIDPKFFVTLAKKTDKWTNAELEYLEILARKNAQKDGRDIVTYDDVINAFPEAVKRNKERIEQEEKDKKKKAEEEKMRQLNLANAQMSWEHGWLQRITTVGQAAWVAKWIVPPAIAAIISIFNKGNGGGDSSGPLPD